MHSKRDAENSVHFTSRCHCSTFQLPTKDMRSHPIGVGIERLWLERHFACCLM